MHEVSSAQHCVKSIGDSGLGNVADCVSSVNDVNRWNVSDVKCLATFVKSTIIASP